MFVVCILFTCQHPSQIWFLSTGQSTFQFEWNPVFKVKHKPGKFSRSECSKKKKKMILNLSLPKFKDSEAVRKSHICGRLMIDWTLSAYFISLEKLRILQLYLTGKVEQNSTATVKECTEDMQILNGLVNIGKATRTSLPGYVIHAYQNTNTHAKHAQGKLELYNYK